MGGGSLVRNARHRWHARIENAFAAFVVRSVEQPTSLRGGHRGGAMRACCLSERCRREAYVERRPQGAVADPWRCTPTAVQPLCANQDAANKWMLASARVETWPFRCLKSLAANPQLISQQTAAKNLLAAGISQRTHERVSFSAGWNVANDQSNQQSRGLCAIGSSPKQNFQRVLVGFLRWDARNRRRSFLKAHCVFD